VLLYARGAAGVTPSSVRVSLRRARALAPPDRLWIVGGPTAALAASESLGASRVVKTAARGALPLLPVLLELGRLGGAEVLCVLAPDDLRVAREKELRRSVAAALEAASRAPRASLLIGLADDGHAAEGLARLMPAPATGEDVARPLLAMLAVPVGPRGHRPARREVLRDSGVLIGRVSSLLALYKDFLPGAFLPLVRAWLAGETERTLAALPEASLQRDLLPRALRRLRVVGPVGADRETDR